MALRLALVVFVMLLVSAERLAGQDALASARDLYASAQYTEALSVLDQLASRASSNDERQSIELYRTLCLLAVGRRDDADRSIEAIIALNPMYRPSDDLPPRMRVAFSDAKKRLLPVLVQQQYADARSAFDRREFEAAAGAFKRVIDALNDPDMAVAAGQPPLADLRTLATGFFDLSVKAIPPPPPPPPPPAPEPPVNLPPRIYTGEEAGVRPPITITQELPRYPGAVPPTGLKGVVDVVINEQGTVDSAAIIVSVTSSYDKTVLSAVRKWQFQPARANGAPVKFRKRIQINISPPTD